MSCHLCQRQIGRRRTHCVTESGPIVCARCLGDKASHARLYPKCGKRWHDAHDHGVVFASRAAAQCIRRDGGIRVTNPEVIESKQEVQRRRVVLVPATEVVSRPLPDGMGICDRCYRLAVCDDRLLEGERICATCAQRKDDD
jgi:hypothetical protein